MTITYDDKCHVWVATHSNQGAQMDQRRQPTGTDQSDLFHEYAKAALTGLLAGRSGTVDAARMAKYVRTAKAIAREMVNEDQG